jgi:hypothetical protein
MPPNIRMHLTGYSGLRALPPAGDAGRYAAFDAAGTFLAPWPLSTVRGSSLSCRIADTHRV